MSNFSDFQTENDPSTNSTKAALAKAIGSEQAAPTTPSVTMKQLMELRKAPGRQWVGDGFHVHGIFGYERDAASRSPFLLLDYAPEEYFKPVKDGAKSRGVGTHPHKGFETVTIAYQGEVEHKDSKGGGGIIGPGDCQWMTAGRGIQHSEFHSKAFSENGGNFEMVQLWVNLPQKFKNTKPKYQSLSSQRIPSVPISGECGTVRLYAGEYLGKAGPAKTFIAMNVWDVLLNKKGVADLPQPEGWTTMIAVLKGAVRVNGHEVKAQELIHLTHQGSGVRVDALQESKLLLLAGEPIDEPIAAEGPFVMNTDAEIRQAVADFKSGKF